MCKAATALVLKLLNIEGSDEPFVSESELKLVLSGAAKSGSLRAEENDMISSVLELNDTAVRLDRLYRSVVYSVRENGSAHFSPACDAAQVHEIMTPLVDVMALEESCTAAAVRQLWVENSHSRIPVYNDRVDNITGIMYVYDLLKVQPPTSRRFRSRPPWGGSDPALVPLSDGTTALARGGGGNRSRGFRSAHRAVMVLST